MLQLSFDVAVIDDDVDDCGVDDIEVMLLLSLLMLLLMIRMLLLMIAVMLTF